MDSQTERRYAIGPLSTVPVVDAPIVVPNSDDWTGDPVRIELPDGLWLVTSQTPVFEATRPLAARTHTALVFDCWNSMQQDVAMARYRIERSVNGETTTELAEYRMDDLARGGVLPMIANDAFFQLVRRLSKPAKEKAADRKHREQREKVMRFLTALVDAGVLSFVEGKSIASIAERSHTVLYSVSKSKPERIANLRRVLLNSIYTSTDTKARSPEELGEAIKAALTHL
jgi:hypothetical protein